MTYMFKIQHNSIVASKKCNTSKELEKPMFLCGKNSKIALSLQQLENIFTFKKFFQ